MPGHPGLGKSCSWWQEWFPACGNVSTRALSNTLQCHRKQQITTLQRLVWGAINYFVSRGGEVGWFPSNGKVIMGNNWWVFFRTWNTEVTSHLRLGMRGTLATAEWEHWAKGHFMAQHWRSAWIQRKGGVRQKGRKDKSMECWGQTDTADLKAALLGRGRKKKERDI